MGPRGGDHGDYILLVLQRARRLLGDGDGAIGDGADLRGQQQQDLLSLLDKRGDHVTDLPFDRRRQQPLISLLDFLEKAERLDVADLP